MTLDERLEEIMTEHRFLQILTTPWKQQPAYKLGIINDRGGILRQRDELTESHERQAYPDVFYAYCWNVKRLMEQVLTNTVDANTLIKSVWALKEQYGGLNPQKYETHLLNYLEEKGISKEQFGGMLIGETPKFETDTPAIGEVFGVSLYKNAKRLLTIKELKKMAEDGAAAPANNVGGGQMAGVSPGQEPPMPKKSTTMQKRKKLQRRQQERIKQDIQTINIVKPNS